MSKFTDKEFKLAKKSVWFNGNEWLNPETKDA